MTPEYWAYPVWFWKVMRKTQSVLSSSGNKEYFNGSGSILSWMSADLAGWGQASMLGPGILFLLTLGDAMNVVIKAEVLSYAWAQRHVWKYTFKAPMWCL